VSSSRVIAWTEAFRFLGRNRTVVIQGVAVLLLTTFVVNLPWLPGLPWLRGFTTGFMVTAVLSALTWMAWVPSGLAHRIQGAMAEDWTAELLAEQPDAMHVVPSLKFGSEDIDHVVVTSTRILAVETKWTASRPGASFVEDACRQADRVGHHLRMQLTRSNQREPVGPLPVDVLVVVWGPNVPRDLHEEHCAAHGTVTVVGSDAVPDAVADRGQRLVGPDFAADLAARLTALAVQRDRRALPASRTVRWLARAR